MRSRKNVVDHSQNCCCRGRGTLKLALPTLHWMKWTCFKCGKPKNKACRMRCCGREMLSCTSNVSISWFSCVFWCLLDLSASNMDESSACGSSHRIWEVIIFDWDDTLLCSSAINAQQWRQDQVLTFSGDMMTWDLVWLFGFAPLWCESVSKLLGHQSPEMCVVWSWLLWLVLLWLLCIKGCDVSRWFCFAVWLWN